VTSISRCQVHGRDQSAWREVVTEYVKQRRRAGVLPFKLQSTNDHRLPVFVPNKRSGRTAEEKAGDTPDNRKDYVPDAAGSVATTSST
jgi:hypothetical protein